jgi:hypothetical protein
VSQRQRFSGIHGAAGSAMVQVEREPDPLRHLRPSRSQVFFGVSGSLAIGPLFQEDLGYRRVIGTTAVQIKLLMNCHQVTAVFGGKVEPS